MKHSASIMRTINQNTHNGKKIDLGILSTKKQKTSGSPLKKNVTRIFFSAT